MSTLGRSVRPLSAHVFSSTAYDTSAPDANIQRSQVVMSFRASAGVKVRIICSACASRVKNSRYHTLCSIGRTRAVVVCKVHTLSAKTTARLLGHDTYRWQTTRHRPLCQKFEGDLCADAAQSPLGLPCLAVGIRYMWPPVRALPRRVHALSSDVSLSYFLRCRWWLFSIVVTSPFQRNSAVAVTRPCTAGSGRLGLCNGVCDTTTDSAQSQDGDSVDRRTLARAIAPAVSPY
jgi:hypothetical protein